MRACVAAGQVAGTSVPAQYAAAAAIVPRTGSVVVARGVANRDGGAGAGRAAVGSGGLDHQHMRAIGERPGVQLAGIAVIHGRRMLRPFQGAVDKERDLGYGGGGERGRGDPDHGARKRVASGDAGGDRKARRGRGRRGWRWRCRHGDGFGRRGAACRVGGFW